MTIQLFSSFLVVLFVFILLTLRVVYFCFILKEDPIKAIKVKMPRIPKGSLLAIFKKEKKEEENSKWG